MNAQARTIESDDQKLPKTPKGTVALLGTVKETVALLCNFKEIITLLEESGAIEYPTSLQERGLQSWIVNACPEFGVDDENVL